MVTVDKMQRGMARYIEEQILPPMKGADRWIVTGIATMGLAKLPELINQVQSNSAIKALGIVGSDGTVDIERILESIRPAAHATPASIKVPITGGTITMTAEDLDIIKRYIEQA